MKEDLEKFLKSIVSAYEQRSKKVESIYFIGTIDGRVDLAKQILDFLKKKSENEKLSCLEWIIINAENPVIKDIPQHKIEYIWGAAVKHEIESTEKED